VDNYTQDGLAQTLKNDYPQVRYLSRPDNLWHTGGHNLAFDKSAAPYFFILNSDVYFKSNLLKQLYDYMEKHSDVGAVESGEENDAGIPTVIGTRHNSLWVDIWDLTVFKRFWYPKSATEEFRYQGRDRRKNWDSEVITDSHFFTRRKLFKDGLYDTNMKLYFTENDLSKRIQAQGFRTVHMGEVALRHSVSSSVNAEHWHKIATVFATDTLYYYRKYHGPLSAFLLYAAFTLSNTLTLIKKSLSL